AVEREALANVKDEDVMKRFQNMTDRRGEMWINCLVKGLLE
ncbi:hypothetical protein Tco_0081452, partial [Tanacetum coccineum]